MFLFKLLFLSSLAGLSFSCHPESRFLCDNPCGNWTCEDHVHNLLCEPICDSSQSICMNESPGYWYYKQCYHRCPPDQCESDSCPSCETVCPPCAEKYEALCEMPSCFWNCKPDENVPQPQCEQQSTTVTDCPSPRCELQSEMPACMYNPAPKMSLF